MLTGSGWQSFILIQAQESLRITSPLLTGLFWIYPGKIPRLRHSFLFEQLHEFQSSLAMQFEQGLHSYHQPFPPPLPHELPKQPLPLSLGMAFRLSQQRWPLPFNWLSCTNSDLICHPSFSMKTALFHIKTFLESNCYLKFLHDFGQLIPPQ